MWRIFLDLYIGGIEHFLGGPSKTYQAAGARVED